MPEKDKLVIWPLYFDSARSRSEGRRVPLQDSVQDPDLEILITAAVKAGFEPDIEREKRHPRTWHLPEMAGRISLPRQGSKSEMLKRIAISMKERGRKR